MSIGGYFNASYTITESTWTHVVFTWAAGSDEIKLYINGDFKETVSSGAGSTGALRSSTHDIWLGGQAGFTRWTTGKIGQTLVWTKEATATEVTELYNSGKGLMFR